MSDKADLLLNLFTERDEVFGEHTISILNELDNILEGIAVFLRKPPEQVTCEAVELDRNLLLFRVVTKFDGKAAAIMGDDGNVTEMPAADEQGDPLYQVITIGIPFSMINISPREISDFLVRSEKEKTLTGSTTFVQSRDALGAFDQDDQFHAVDPKAKRVLH